MTELVKWTCECGNVVISETKENPNDGRFYTNLYCSKCERKDPLKELFVQEIKSIKGKGWIEEAHSLVNLKKIERRLHKEGFEIPTRLALEIYNLGKFDRDAELIKAVSELRPKNCNGISLDYSRGQVFALEKVLELLRKGED